VKTIAEHVHSQALCDRLRELGIERIQGDLIGSPCPIAQLFEPTSRHAG
jgi:EAL domain-containing protein (putative c-di-GMP-specific phosphodiesterase class I)